MRSCAYLCVCICGYDNAKKILHTYLDDFFTSTDLSELKNLSILTQPRGMAQGGDISDSVPTPVPF